MSGRRLGQVTGGSLSEGLDIRLDPTVSVEDVKQGSYLVIQGRRGKFFGMVTDLVLGSGHPAFTAAPPDMSDPFIAQVMEGTGIYSVLKVAPQLEVNTEAALEEDRLKPVKTVPSHFSVATAADEEEISAVFGAEDETHFHIGQPLDMDLPVCVNLDRLAERSVGIFGKSGTGKTFLTRLVLAGMVQKRLAVNLIFDMHNEYGWVGTKEGSARGAPGLKQLYPSRVTVFTLDSASTQRRGARFDGEVSIGYDDIDADDIAMLRESMGLSQPMVESVYRLANRFGERWLSTFIDSDTEEVARNLGLSSGTLQPLRRKFDRYLLSLGFVQRQPSGDSVGRILECLQRNQNVVLEFGSFSSSLHAYILVANILSRRIYDSYRIQKEKSLGGGAEEPRQLVITIEEAHKFLNPEVAGLTIFGTIAREMRKYNATLLVVDQRPSGISDEVMSQIGTRITCLLDDEKDISAVLTGISGANALRGVLARLESKQQALILGHAVPMPVVLRTREYGPEARNEFREEATDLEPKSKGMEAVDAWFKLT